MRKLEPPIYPNDLLLKAEYDLQQGREEYFLAMKVAGKVIILPKPNELQLDIDSEEGYEKFKVACDVFMRNWPPEGGDVFVEEKVSESGLPHRHITVTLPFAVDPMQRIAFQAAFGSDHIRELLSCLRMFFGEEHPTLFAEAAPSLPDDDMPL